MEPGWWSLRYGATTLGFVWGWAQKRNNHHCMASRVLSRKLSLPLALMPNTSLSFYMLLEPFQRLPQCWGGVWISFKSTEGPLRGDAWEACSSSDHPNPTGFYRQKLWGLIFLALEPWAGWSGVVLESLTPEISHPLFTHQTWVWDWPICISMSPSLLPIGMNVTSLIPWLLAFHTAQFSDSSGW